MKVILVAMLIVLPLSGDAVSAEVLNVIVDSNTINVNGHWLCTDGTVELRLEGSRVYADGWQVGPIMEDPGLQRARKQPETAQEAVLKELRQHQLAWAAEGADERSIIEASKDFLENSGELSGPIEEVEGAWWVPWKGQEQPSLMNLASVAPQRSDHEIRQAQERAARALFEWIPQQLELGHLLLFAPDGSFKLIPRSRRAEALRLLNDAKSRVVPITGENWDGCGGLIESTFAELQRRPVDESLKQVR